MAFVIDMSKSQRVFMRPIDVRSVRLEDDFWAPRLRTLWEVTLPSQLEIFEKTGRIENFRRAAGKASGDFQGLIFNDSDVYKWLEAVAYSYAYSGRHELMGMASSVIDEVVAAQDADGYLDTYFTGERKKDRWKNERDNHELYCAGHLIQAGIATKRAMGDTKLFNASRRFADLICDLFGPAKEKTVPGHPVTEMALVELYRETGEKRYLDQAQLFIDLRGRGIIGGSPYQLDHVPIRDMKEITGHAVRALYLMSGVADVYAETGDASLLSALSRLWEDLQKKTYVTGGVGSRYEWESIGEAYELPNARAYAETCAAIANVMWNHRMLLITGDEKYADAMELALYNGALSGISLDGLSYFYVNPLADRGKSRRQQWFDCACCPTNIIRLLAYLPSLFYGVSDRGIYVNLYGKSSSTISHAGRTVKVRQETDYPWDGRIRIEVDAQEPVSLHLRIPGWARSARISAEGKSVEGVPGTYAEIEVKDEAELDLPMPVEKLIANPRVLDDRGSVALKRGPLVYCVEHAGNDFDPWDLAISASDEFTAEDGVLKSMRIKVVRGNGAALRTAQWTYQRKEAGDVQRVPVNFTAVPYYAWANREPGPMIVWLLAR
ncbi:MAG: glycoside hydrolase family 127 protein [Thermoprotei archaeon]|nr:glycoside hydrolase family 127 protein [TACK group archaeon]